MFANKNQPNKILYITLCLFLSFGFVQQPEASVNAYLDDGEVLKLIGLGIHKELRNDIYIGALFGPMAITKVDQLVNVNVAKRMSIRFLAGYSHRKMSRHWRERLALNNAREEWQPYSKDIVAFSQIFIRNFIKGDELNIDHIPGKGTYFYLNGTLFKTIKKPQLSNLLLNVWLGSNPPTKAFKKSIRGLIKPGVKSSMAETYSLLEANTGRFDSDLEKFKRVALESEKKAIAARKAAAQKVAAKKLAAEKLIAKKAKEKRLAIEKIAAIKAAKIAAEKAAIKKIADKKAAVKRAAAQKIAAKKALNNKTRIAEKYTKELTRKIRKHQKYPKKALKNQEQGTVVAKVTIDAKGELLDIQLIERSGSKYLDRAVIKMVNNSAPFNTIPSKLNMKQFKFDLPITFRL